MRVVDTSAWIEWLTGSATGDRVAADIPAREHHVVPTIVQFELAVWAARELSEAQTERIIADSVKCVVISLSTEIALRAADVRRLHRLSTADALVYSTAMELQADLLTCDVHFQGLPGVVYVPKAEK